MTRAEALEEAIKRTRTRLEAYCSAANAGRMPGDAREFMRRVQCGFDSLFEEAKQLEQEPAYAPRYNPCGYCHSTGRVIGLHEQIGGGAAQSASSDYYIECPVCGGTGIRR